LIRTRWTPGAADEHEFDRYNSQRSLMSTLIGAHLGPYEITSPIGAGGMGEVYRARDTRLAREVAIKVLPAALATDAESLARFEREARSVAALNHTNILAIHDIGQEGSVVYVVTELLEGSTLRDRLASGPVPPHRAVEVLVQIVRGLAAAHDRGVVHRDVKPENIFITRDGVVKILDFGVAVRDTAMTGTDGQVTAVLTYPGILVGTPTYMSPEQLRGELVTPRSDLFAFGVVAHEMLTGVHPFKRDAPAETMAAILRADPVPLERAVPSLPTGVAKLLHRCLEKRASDRPASAKDLAFYLELLGGTAGSPIQADALQRVRRRVLATSCGLMLLVVLVMWGFVRIMAERTVAGAIEADLGRAQRLVSRVHDEHLRGLMLTARLLASIPNLKALLATDPATIRDFLLSYQSTYPGAPLLVALDTQGHVLARTDTVTGLQLDAADAWVEAFVRQQGEPTVVDVSGRPFHAAAAAADAGGNVFGYIVAATPVGESFAQELRDATQDEVVLLSSTALLASTLRNADMPWKSLAEWRREGGAATRLRDIQIGAQRFATREVAIVDSPALSVIVAKSRDEAVTPYRQIQSGLVTVGLLCAAVALVGGFLIIRTNTASLAERESSQRS
jgi:hypothetical protein